MDGFKFAEPLFPVDVGSITNFAVWLLKVAATYLAVLAVYRLYFAPAAKFPGPKLAALTFLYEFYYDVWLDGQYTWKIQELHKKYGPFVRINPFEAHCNDPDFFDALYVGPAKRRTDKWFWVVRQTWTRLSVFKTIEHDLHRQRRGQLNPFFSKGSVRSLEPLILDKVNELCERLEELCESKSVVSLTHAFVALTLDVIARVCFGVPYETQWSLQLDGFAREYYEEMVTLSRTMHLAKQFPWIFRLPNWVPKFGPRTAAAGREAAQRRQQNLTRQITAVIDRHNRGEEQPGGGSTIFHSMLDADVPPEEKSVARLIDEAHTMTAAGSMTTANTLETLFYHLLSNSTHLSLLRKELDEAIPDLGVIPSVAELERLPFLTAVVHEGLRLGKGVPHRLARVSPDHAYRYRDTMIPRGVPVGMTSITLLENPDIYPDPDAFMPERWIPFDAPEVRRRRKSLVVFGGGTRICLGLNLAWAELYLTVAVVVRKFGGRMQLHDVVFERDIKITTDGFNPLSSKESRGLRVTISPKSGD